MLATRTWLLGAALLMTALAGCISPDAFQKASTNTHAVPPPTDRIDGMTADVQQKDTAIDCASGTLPLPTSACYQREVTVTGRIGLDTLPVTLTANNGGIVLKASEDDAWSFHALVKVRGSSPDDAKKGLDTMWSWSHTDGTKHYLLAGPNASVTSSPLPLVGPEVMSIRYEVTLPAWLVATIKAHTTNGGITVSGLESDSLDLKTTNGGVAIDGPVKSADVSTTNGGIAAQLDPTSIGKVSLRTTNGGVAVTVPEDAAHGYSVDAKTTNGRVAIGLHDGNADSKDKTQATFTSRDYDARAIQTELTISTTNGGVTVGPA